MHCDHCHPLALRGVDQLAHACQLSIRVNACGSESLGGAAHHYDERLGISEIGRSRQVVDRKVHALLGHDRADHLIVRALAARSHQCGELRNSVARSSSSSRFTCGTGRCGSGSGTVRKHGGKHSRHFTDAGDAGHPDTLFRADAGHKAVLVAGFDNDGVVRFLKYRSNELVGQVAAAGASARVHCDDRQSLTLRAVDQLAYASQFSVRVNTCGTESLGGTAHYYNERFGVAKISRGSQVVEREVHPLFAHDSADHLIVCALAARGHQRGKLCKSFPDPGRCAAAAAAGAFPGAACGHRMRRRGQVSGSRALFRTRRKSEYYSERHEKRCNFTFHFVRFLPA